MGVGYNHKLTLSPSARLESKSVTAHQLLDEARKDAGRRQRGRSSQKTAPGHGRAGDTQLRVLPQVALPRADLGAQHRGDAELFRPPPSTGTGAERCAWAG